MAKKKITPEERASWVEARRRMEDVMRRLDAKIAEERDREARRRRRLHRLSLGLLGR